MRRSWHLFGNDGRRYRTLAQSPDLDPSLASSLERFSWGQARSADYLCTLARDPALWVTPLAGGRHAVTRVFQGDKDEAGRWSQSFLTLIVPSDEWVSSISTSLVRFCGNEEAWRVTDRIAVASPPRDVPTRRTPRAVEPDHVATLLGQALHGGSPVVVEPELLTLADCEDVFRGLSERERSRCGFAIRAVSDALGVTLSVLDPRFVTRPCPLGRTVLRRDGFVDRQPASPGSPARATVPSVRPLDLATRPPPASAAPISPFGTVVPAVLDLPLDSNRRTLTMTRPVAIAFAVLLLTIAVTGAATHHRIGTANAGGANTTGTLDDRLRELAANRDDLMRQVRAVVEANSENGVTKLSARLETLESRFDLLDRTLDELAQRLASLMELAAEQSSSIAASATDGAALRTRLDDSERRAAERLDEITSSLHGLGETMTEQRTELHAGLETWSRRVEELESAGKDLMNNQAVTVAVRNLRDLLEDLDKQVKTMDKHVKALGKPR